MRTRQIRIPNPIKSFLLAAGMFLLLPTADSQVLRPSPSFGIGFQVGDPTGLSIQFYRETGPYADILLSYNFDDYFFGSLHALWDTHLDPGHHFHVYYGPGGYMRVWDYPPDDNRDQVFVGISGNFGLNFVISRFEFFGQVTPRLDVAPATNFDLGGGIGARFFF